MKNTITKKIANNIILAVLIALSPLAAKAAPMDAKVVVVNNQQVLDGSSAYKDLKNQMEAKRKEYQKQITTKGEELKKLEADLIKQKTVLAKEELAKKQKAFVDEVEKVRKDVQNKRISLDSAYKKAIGDIQVTVKKIIEEMAVAQKFNLAVPHSQLIYADPGMDITKEVTSKLNQRLPKVTLKF